MLLVSSMFHYCLILICCDVMLIFVFFVSFQVVLLFIVLLHDCCSCEYLAYSVIQLHYFCCFVLTVKRLWAQQSPLKRIID